MFPNCQIIQQVILAKPRWFSFPLSGLVPCFNLDLEIWKRDTWINLRITGIQQHWCLQKNGMTPINTKANVAQSFKGETGTDSMCLQWQAHRRSVFLFLTKCAERIPLSWTVTDAPECVAAVLRSVPPWGKMRWLWRSFHSLGLMTHSYRWKVPTVTQCCSHVL